MFGCFHSPHQTAERSRLVCFQFCLCRRAPPPLGLGSVLAPVRPGHDFDLEQTPEPGTELDTTPPTPVPRRHREFITG